MASADVVTPGERDLSQFNPFLPDVQADLNGWFGALRRQEPIHHNQATGTWFVTSREAIREALMRPDVFSSAMEEMLTAPPPPEVADEVARIRAEGCEHVPALIFLDPPAHDRQRTLIRKAFTTRIVRSLEADVALLVDELLSELVDRQSADFVAGFAIALPALAIARLLNVAQERMEDFRRWADARVGAAGNQPTAEEYVRNTQDELEMQRYFAAELDKRRSRPEDDLLTAMLEARLEKDDDAEGEPLSTEECLATLSILLAAGIETTANLLSSTVRHLVEHPELWDWVHDDPGPRTERLVEESLRFMSPAKAVPRITRAESVLEGVTIPAGAVVFLVLAAANRDETAFPDPESLDCTRDEPPKHLAFGHGKHFCVGAMLARLEVTIALQRMVEQCHVPVLSASNTFEQRPGFILPGLKELHVELTPRIDLTPSPPRP